MWYKCGLNVAFFGIEAILFLDTTYKLHINEITLPI
jgi:hypothetical protein